MLHDLKQTLKGELDLRSNSKHGHHITKNTIKPPTLQVLTTKRPSVYTLYSSRLVKKVMRHLPSDEATLHTHRRANEVKRETI